MGVAVLTDRPGLRLARHAKVLKRDDYTALLDAHALRAQARQDYEQERRRGYEEGLAQARAEAAAHLLASASAAAKALDALETRIVGVVMRALRGVLEDSDEQVLFEHALRRVRALLQHETLLVLRVCPQQESAARAALHAMAQALSAPAFIEVRADASLARGACIVETEHAVVDASLEAQLAAIERALRTHFEHTGTCA